MKVLIIAGGTGGHVYPALSIANEFQNDGNTIYWIGKKNSLEENIAISEDFSFHSINARGFLGKNFFAKIGSIFFVFAATRLLISQNMSYSLKFARFFT